MVVKRTGKNLQRVKASNRKAIIKTLREKECSGNELAKLLKLSPAGIQVLVDEMVAEGLVYKEDAEVVIRGRRPINIRINPHIGVVAIISLSTSTAYKVSICDFKANILSSCEQNCVENLPERLLLDIQRLVEETGFKLYGIAIETAGKVHKETGAFHYAPNMDKLVSVNFKELLEEHFHVGVVIKNKLIFSLFAERKYNTDVPLDNCLYIKGLGSALCIEGRIFEGGNGFAGELGLVNIDIYGALNEEDYYNPYRSNHYLSAYTALKTAVQYASKGEIKEDIRTEEIFRMYNEGIEFVKKPVRKFIRIFSLTVKNMLEFMDLNQLVIAGDLATLNDDGLSLISKYVNESAMDKLEVQVLRANPQYSSFMGAFEYAMDIAYATILK